MKDLKERKKLMEETPPEEVKYWFEYTGSLQVCSIRVYMFCNEERNRFEARVSLPMRFVSLHRNREMRITPTEA